MKNKRSRQIFFVCCSLNNDNLISKVISAKSVDEASDIFIKQFEIKPKEIHGPFYKVKQHISENTRVLKFINNNPQKAIYNDWIVNAFMLNEPADHAYLVFIKRNDDKKTPFPKGTITAPIKDLRFI